MIEKLVKSKNFLSASGMMTTVRVLSSLTLNCTLKHIAVMKYKHLLDYYSVQDTSLIKTPSYNKFQNGFAHIFAGGYAAGYYSYKWAEVLSADAFFCCC